MSESFNRVALLQQIRLDDDSREDDRQVAFELISGRLSLRGHTWELPVHPHWSVDPFQDPLWRAEYQSLTWLAPLRRQATEGDDDALQAWWWLASAWLESLNRLEPGEGTPWLGDRPGDRLAEIVRGLSIVGPQGWLLDAINVHITYLTHQVPAQEQWLAGEALVVAAAAFSSSKVERKAGEILTSALREVTHHQVGNVTPDATHVMQCRQNLQRIRRRLLITDAAVQGIEEAEKKLTYLHELAMEHESRRAYHVPQYPEIGILVDNQGWITFRFGEYQELIHQRHSEWQNPETLGSITYSHSGINWIDDDGKYHHRPGPGRTMVEQPEYRNLLLPREVTDPQYDYLVEVRREEHAGFIFLVLSTPQPSSFGRRRAILLTASDGVAFIYDQNESQHEEAHLAWHLGKNITCRNYGDWNLLEYQGKSAYLESFIESDERIRSSHDQVSTHTSNDDLGSASLTRNSLKFHVPQGEAGTVISPSRIHRRAAVSRILRAMKNAVAEDTPIVLDDDDLHGLSSVARAKNTFSVDFYKTANNDLIAQCDHISAKYAFHLLRGQEVVYKSNYQTENRMLFSTLPAGLYRVKVFAATGQGRLSVLSGGVRISKGR